MKNQILYYFKKYRKQLIALVILLLGTNILRFIFPLLYQSGIDKGYLERDFQTILNVSLQLIVVLIGITLLQFVFYRLKNVVNNKIVSDFSIFFINEVLDLKKSEFDKLGNIGAVKALIDERYKVSNFLEILFSKLISNTTLFIGYLILTIAINPFFVFVYLVYTPLIILKSRRFAFHNQEREMESFERYQNLEAEYFNTIQNEFSRRINNLKPLYKKRLRVNDYFRRKSEYKWAKVTSWNIAIGTMVDSSISIAVFIATGLLLVFLDSVTLGEWFAIQYMAIRLLGPLASFGSMYEELQTIKNSFARINKVLKLNKEGNENNKLNLSRLDTIDFKSISMEYKPNQPIFDNLNFRITRGDKYLVTGKNGAGKSSLINILLGIYEPKQGEMLINDISYQNYRLSSIRSKISYVPQFSTLENKSFAQNIFMSDYPPNYDYDNFEMISQVTGVSEILNSKENGLDELIIDQGSNLSGGEKQRIMICAALLKKPELLVLDESFSNIDASYEKSIMDYLINGQDCKNMALVLISHKKSSFDYFSNIFYLDNGIFHSQYSVAEISDLLTENSSNLKLDKKLS